MSNQSAIIQEKIIKILKQLGDEPFDEDYVAVANQILPLISEAYQKGREEGYAEGWRDAEEIGIEQVRITEQAVKGGQA